MSLKNLISSLFFIFLLLLNFTAKAEPAELLPFTSGSYQKILENNAKKPFMMVVWSLTCSSCLKDMALLSNIHKSRPEIKIIMLTTDDFSTSSEQIQQILEKNELTGLEHWIYADENTQKLQYEIDPKWYGELPRTYFLDKAHHRVSVSGVLSKADYESQFAKMLE